MGARRVLEVTTVNCIFLLRSNEYYESKENLKQKLSKHVVIYYAMITLVKQLETMAIMMENERRILKHIYKTLMRKNSAQNMVVEKSIGMLVKIDFSCFVGRQFVSAKLFESGARKKYLSRTILAKT